MAFSKSILFAAALGSVASALPASHPRHYEQGNQGSPIAIPAFPQTGAGQELSLSDTDLQQVVLVTIGRGIQNYTCPHGADRPVQDEILGGAVAQLFDITEVATQSAAFAEALNTVSFFKPRPSLEDVDDAVLSTAITLGGSDLIHIRDEAAFPKVCYHEFTEDNIPKFDCGDRGLIFGRLIENVPAPTDAPLSPNTETAIPWLVLEAREGSRTFTKIIRIVTAGGSPPTSCEGVAPDEVISVDYAAQYWMFNNATTGY